MKAELGWAAPSLYGGAQQEDRCLSSLRTDLKLRTTFGRDSHRHEVAGPLPIHLPSPHPPTCFSVPACRLPGRGPAGLGAA